MKLTQRQRDILSREFAFDQSVLILCQSEDRVAKNLEAKGLGFFTDNRWQYSWRPRSGYTNSFHLNAKGLEVRYG